MATIENFEELKSWQNARRLANVIYDLADKPAFSKDRELAGQIKGAAGSVMHNIAEGFEAGLDPEFVRFLKIARRSVSEVQSEIYLALDRKYLSGSELRTAYDLAKETKRLINGLITYLREHPVSRQVKERMPPDQLYACEILSEEGLDFPPGNCRPTA